MSQTEAISILGRLNAWRRGQPPYDEAPSPPPDDPQAIGQAIDEAIRVLKTQPKPEKEKP